MLRKAEKQNTCFYFMSFLASLANKLISMLESPTYYIIDPRIHKSNIIHSVTADRMHLAYKKPSFRQNLHEYKCSPICLLPSNKMKLYKHTQISRTPVQNPVLCPTARESKQMLYK